jgi:hypothetical protein
MAVAMSKSLYRAIATTALHNKCISMKINNYYRLAKLSLNHCLPKLIVFLRHLKNLCLGPCNPQEYDLKVE